MEKIWDKKRKRVTEQIFNLVDVSSANLTDIYVTLYALGAMQAYLDYPNLIRNIEDLDGEAREVCLDMDLADPLNDDMLATILTSAFSDGYRGIAQWFDIKPENTIAVAEFYKSKPLHHAFIFIKSLTQKLHQQDQERQSHMFEGYKLISIEQRGNKVFCDAGCGADYTNSDEKGGFLFGSKAYCPTCAKKDLPTIIKYGEKSHIKAWCPEGMSFKDFVLSIRRGRAG